MTCKLGDGCECVSNPTLKMFCENWLAPEQPLDQVHKDNIKNWSTLPIEMRDKCVAHLKVFMKDVPDIIAHWTEQSRRGVIIGSDKIRFHLAEGMQIRNALRSVVKDDELPDVVQPNGEPGKNWDDFYYGALEALIAGHGA